MRLITKIDAEGREVPDFPVPQVLMNYAIKDGVLNLVDEDETRISFVFRDGVLVRKPMWYA